tara:strand:+ start:263 stop:757 length:495 start_codon:yes stop_codon:yes gene_type:complete
MFTFKKTHKNTLGGIFTSQKLTTSASKRKPTYKKSALSSKKRNQTSQKRTKRAFFSNQEPKKALPVQKKEMEHLKNARSVFFFKSRILKTPKDSLFEKKDCPQNISSTFGGIFTSPHQPNESLYPMIQSMLPSPETFVEKIRPKDTNQTHVCTDIGIRMATHPG